jgi:cytochrome c553
LRNVRNSGLVELGLLPVAARCRFIFVFLVPIALPFGAAQSQPADRAPDTMAARVLACASCHGAEGEGTSDVYFPRLAGKPAAISTTSWLHSGTGAADTRR